MSDRETIIKDFEHSVNKAHGEYYDYVDLTVEDADKILKLLEEQEQTIKSATWVQHLYRETISSFQGTICKLNAALEEQPDIVRCKDCKHYMTIHCTCDGCCISDDWFCADGERR